MGRGRLRGDSWGVDGVARGGGGGFWSTPVVLGGGFTVCLLQTKTKIIIVINK